jgi:hypothetical protein
MPNNSNLIFESYYNLTGANALYQQNWMCNETIFRLLNSHYPRLKKTFNFTREGLNRALSAKAGPCTGQNDYGLYVAKFSTECPYSGDKRRVSFYFRQATINDNPPDDPVSAADIVDAHASTNQLRRNCIRLGRSIKDRDLVATGVEGDRAPAGTINHITPKRKVCTNDHDCAAATVITPENDDDRVPEVGCLVGSDVGEVGCQVGSPVGSNVGSFVPSY